MGKGVLILSPELSFLSLMALVWLALVAFVLGI